MQTQIKNWLRRLAHLPRLLRENFFLLTLVTTIPLDMIAARWAPVLEDADQEYSEQFTHQKLSLRRKLLDNQNVKLYAPVYFGRGLWLGNLWNVQTGYGRWNYILKDNLPSLRGKRILDLGANSAHNSIQMLRAGAAEVVAVERNPQQIDLGGFILGGFECVDGQKYNLKYIQVDMKDIPSMDLGRFDMVTALCSLYYLSDEDMAALTEHVSTISNLFVLECNTGNLERSETHLYEKASVEYAVALLKQHGFPNVEVIGPDGYYRPLVIGQKSG